MELYILKDINLENDELLESLPVSLRRGEQGEIYCLGILEKRQIVQGTLEGLLYYHFIYFYGKSPMNFVEGDYTKLHNDYSFDSDLEMIANFRYCYSEYSLTPGLSKEFDLMQVSKSFRNS